MGKSKLLYFIVSALIAVGCSDSEKKTDLAQELAARQMASEIKLLIKRGKVKEASRKVGDFQKQFGHTKTYEEEKAQLIRKGFSAKNQAIVLTSTRLIEMENDLLAYRKETGNWPEPGQIFKPLDAWNNEVYWIVGEPENSYDLLIVSAGPDGRPGSGDEPMIVWTESDVGGYKDKQTGEIVGKRKKEKMEKKQAAKLKKQKNRAAKLVTLDELAASERNNGVPNDKIISLDKLTAASERSQRAGQPEKGEIILSLDEIKEKL